MSYHFTGPQFLHQLNGVFIPALKWRSLVRCPVLSLQVRLSSRFREPYPTPSPKSILPTSNKILSTGMTSCPRMQTAESVIPHLDSPSKVPKQADYPPPHMKHSPTPQHNFFSSYPASPRPYIAVSLPTVCSHEFQFCPIVTHNTVIILV